jgi:phage terminase large subunit
MPSQIRISDIVAQPHLEYFNSMLPHQLDHGGRAAYKSSKNAIKIAKHMLQDKRCEVVIVRQDYSDHKDSTFADMKIAFERLGVKLVEGKHYPKGSDLWIRLPQGNFVHFKHMKEIDKLKGTRPRNPKNQIKIVWYFEITEYKSKWFIDQANASFMRGDKDYFMALYEWNNAPKLSHWTYEFMDMMKEREDAYVKQTNYNDAPKWQQEKFLGKMILKEIAMLSKVDPEQFKSIYLGYPANLSGTVFKQFDLKRNVREPQEHYYDMYIGVDYGSNDATVFTCSGFTKNYNELDTVDMFYHKNGVTGQIMNINDYVDALVDFIKEQHEKYPKNIFTLKVDSANASFIELIKNAIIMIDYVILEPLNKMVRRTNTSKNKSVIQERIDVSEVMFGAGYVHIAPHCIKLIKAVQEAEYNKKGELKDDGTSDIDSIDSWWYSWITEMDIIWQTIVEVI